MWGGDPKGQNVTLQSDDIRRPMVSDIPTPFLDLLEIATYVYCADQAVTRGGSGVDNLGEDWRRRLFYRIPVRHPGLWNGRQMQQALCTTLGFLSEDEYVFEFADLKGDGPSIQQYLPFTSDETTVAAPEEVLLFSGGLDSLGGAIQEAVLDKRKVALVHHEPTTKLAKRHRVLRDLLARRAEHAPPAYVAVTINKGPALTREYTQRSRSFLYAAMGATVAQMYGLSRIRFYENGIVSLNLPPCTQVVGARATRTTHPQVIKGFSEILSLVADKRFDVENPFFWLTKADVLRLIDEAGCADLVGRSTSCMHTRKITNEQPHCGSCSQCIDRRFAVLAAKLEQWEPARTYGVDLLTGERDEGEPRTMVASYVETARQVSKMSPPEFFARYGEVSRVLRHLDGSPDNTALKIFELHKRRAGQVWNVVRDAIAEHADAILDRTLPPSCLLRLVCDAATGEIVPQVMEEPTLVDDNVFRKKGDVWQVRYAGGTEFLLLPSKGAAYLHILLSSPRRNLDVVQIVASVAKDPKKFSLGSAGEVADPDALSAYRARYDDLKEQLAEAKDNNDLGRQTSIREEMQWLADEIGRATGLGGRLRKAADDRRRVKDSCRQAIRRAVENIAQYDRRLAEHLKMPRIRCGASPCYDPGTDIEWST